MKIDKCGFTERKVEAEIKDWDMINLGNIMIVQLNGKLLNCTDSQFELQ